MIGSVNPPRLWRTYSQQFPNLPMEMVAPANERYNCIAWSVGISDRWVWDEIDYDGNGNSSYSEFVKFYQKRGYTPTSSEKNADVALLGHRNGYRVQVKHAARKDFDSNFWLSKMGQGGIIRHQNLEVFEGTPYGEVLMLFRKIN